ncbi:putative selenium-dependent hydroxylase accessory protein YqeC [Halostella sp. JP-L12]|uniref:selenium cofactor biosynthesis protein YqeC n=1 Tax=Halostella TaxID=1843185 RepID=UPI000EF829D6|nr:MULTISPECIES: selenium cofactor biosynthesis protein YqeC [Halostella]NHN48933.1 putative selenium-dependent hydroxylase accessory protein YqeC [Halostella sp. JP-L12]
MDIVSALAADGAAPGDGSTLVSVVGAGGKKTTLYALAGRIDRAVVTATVRIPIFDRHVAAVTVTDDPASALREADDWPLGLVPEREREDRYRGYDAAVVDDIAAPGVADAVLVKADGARTRDLKAPNDREPQVPPASDVVVPVASAHVVGEPLTDDLVHRPERVAAIAGIDVGDEVTPEAVAAVLASERGGMKGVPDGATAVPLVNKVDDGELEAVAREVAAETLARCDAPRVVLARMTAEDPLVAVVE